MFRYVSSGDSVFGAKDLIQDFLRGSDKIDLQRVDAKSATAENDWFTFIGSQAFSATGSASAGQLRAFVVSGDLWQVEGDVNGDRIADLVFQLNVAAGQQLTQSDFMA